MFREAILVFFICCAGNVAANSEPTPTSPATRKPTTTMSFAQQIACQIETDRIQKCLSLKDTLPGIKITKADGTLPGIKITKADGPAMIEKSKQILSCIGAPECPFGRRFKYLTEGSIYMSEKFFGDAFDCITKSLREYDDEDYKNCEGDVNSRFPESPLKNHMEKMMRCAAAKLDESICSVEDRKSFFIFAFGKFEISLDFLDASNGAPIDLTFNSTKYEDMY